MFLMCLCSIAAAQHWITGQVLDAMDGTLADGRKVALFYPGSPEINATDVIGEQGMSGTGSYYMIDIESIDEDWQPGEIVSVKVVENNSGYATRTIAVNLSSDSFDVADIMTLKKLGDAISWLSAMQKDGLVDSYEGDDEDYAYTYDQALAVIAFTLADETDKAAAVLDKMQELQLANGAWYQCYDAVTSSIGHGGCYLYPTGDISWIVMAVNFYEHKTEDAGYREMALRALSWLDSVRNTDPLQEDYGSLDLCRGPACTYPEAISTENNYDAYSAYYYRGVLDRNASLIDRALLIKKYLVEEMWSNSSASNGPFHDIGVFWVGFDDFGFYTDPQSWAILALGSKGPEGENFTRALEWLYSYGYGYGSTRHNQTYNPEIDGFDYWTKPSKDSIWVEGTEGVAAAYYSIGDNVKGDYLHGQVLQDINGGLIYSFSETDPDSIRWNENWRHNSVASTSWFYFNEQKANPFVLDISLDSEIPLSKGWNLFSPPGGLDAQGVNLEVEAGWNLLGYSGEDAFYWLNASVSNSSETRSVADADEWLQPTVYYFDVSYRFVPGNDDYLRRGRGYWLYSTVNLTITFDSLMISSFNWSKVRIRKGEVVKTLSEAQSSGWLQSTIYYFDTASQQYRFIPDDRDIIGSYEGYWLLAFQDNLSLIFEFDICQHLQSCSYSTYLRCNPAVEALTTEAFDEDTLEHFWKDLAALEDSGSLESVEPQDIDDEYVYLTEDEQKRIVAADSAHAVWVDKNGLVPWRLAGYDYQELSGLFKGFFSESGSGCYFLSLIDSNPADAYHYITQNGLLEDNKIGTFYAVLEDIRSDFRHGISSRDPTHEPYTVAEALTEYDEYQTRVSRRGCHSMTRILLALMRSINIPGEETRLGVWFDFGHSSAAWPSLSKVLPHGDNIYNALVKATPSDRLLPDYSYYGEDVLCGTERPCISHRHTSLNAVTYPSAYTKNRCCNPAQYEHTDCQEYLHYEHDPYLTAYEIASAADAISALCQGQAIPLASIEDQPIECLDYIPGYIP